LARNDEDSGYLFLRGVANLAGVRFTVDSGSC
jgi:hypothetical protein